MPFETQYPSIINVSISNLNWFQFNGDPGDVSGYPVVMYRFSNPTAGPADFIAGAYNKAVLGRGAGSGEVSVVRGGPTIGSNSPVSIYTAAATRILGETGYFSQAIANPGNYKGTPSSSNIAVGAWASFFTGYVDFMTFPAGTTGNIDSAIVANRIRISGPTGGTSFGISLSDGVDMNLDGYADVGVGASGAGLIHLFYGGPSFADVASINPDTRSTPYVTLIGGLPPSASFGFGQKAMPYFRTPGFPVVCGAAPFATNSMAMSNAGAIVCVEAHANLRSIPFLDVTQPASNVFTFEGGAAQDLLGFGGMDGGYDVNGDEHPDFACLSLVANNKKGVGYVKWGNPAISGTTSVSSFDVQVLLPGDSSTDMSTIGVRGAFAVALSDINKDGKYEVFFGVPQMKGPNGELYSGGVVILWGGQNYPGLVDFTNVAPDGKNIIVGKPQTQAFFGLTLAGGQDFNGDDIHDLMIGAYNADGGRGLTYGLKGDAVTQVNIGRASVTQGQPISLTFNMFNATYAGVFRPTTVFQFGTNHCYVSLSSNPTQPIATSLQSNHQSGLLMLTQDGTKFPCELNVTTLPTGIALSPPVQTVPISFTLLPPQITLCNFDPFYETLDFTITPSMITVVDPGAANADGAMLSLMGNGAYSNPANFTVGAIPSGTIKLFATRHSPAPTITLVARIGGRTSAPFQCTVNFDAAPEVRLAQFNYYRGTPQLPVTTSNVVLFDDKAPANVLQGLISNQTYSLFKTITPAATTLAFFQSDIQNTNLALVPDPQNLAEFNIQAFDGHQYSPDKRSDNSFLPGSPATEGGGAASSTAWVATVASVSVSVLLLGVRYFYIRYQNKKVMQQMQALLEQDSTYRKEMLDPLVSKVLASTDAGNWVGSVSIKTVSLFCIAMHRIISKAGITHRLYMALDEDGREAMKVEITRIVVLFAGSKKTRADRFKESIGLAHKDIPRIQVGWLEMGDLGHDISNSLLPEDRMAKIDNTNITLNANPVIKELCDKAKAVLKELEDQQPVSKASRAGKKSRSATPEEDQDEKDEDENSQRQTRTTKGKKPLHSQTMRLSPGAKASTSKGSSGSASVGGNIAGHVVAIDDLSPEELAEIDENVSTDQGADGVVHYSISRNGWRKMRDRLSRANNGEGGERPEGATFDEGDEEGDIDINRLDDPSYQAAVALQQADIMHQHQAPKKTGSKKPAVEMASVSVRGGAQEEKQVGKTLKAKAAASPKETHRTDDDDDLEGVDLNNDDHAAVFAREQAKALAQYSSTASMMGTLSLSSSSSSSAVVSPRSASPVSSVSSSSAGGRSPRMLIAGNSQPGLDVSDDGSHRLVKTRSEKQAARDEEKISDKRGKSPGYYTVQGASKHPSPAMFSSGSSSSSSAASLHAQELAELHSRELPDVPAPKGKASKKDGEVSKPSSPNARR